MAVLSSYPNISDPFKQGIHSGLQFAFGGGVVRTDNIVVHVNAGAVTLVNGTTNYVEVTDAGAVVSKILSYSKGAIPLFKVVVVGGAITTITDDRCFTSIGGGGGSIDYGAGTTAQRPATPVAGTMFFDTSIGLPIWYNGTAWIKADGSDADITEEQKIATTLDLLNGGIDDTAFNAAVADLDEAALAPYEAAIDEILLGGNS